MRIRSIILASLVLFLSAAVSSLPAQQQESIASLGSAQRSMVTRAELQAALDTIQRLVNSPGYSAALRARKQADADLIRERLTDGDLHNGDLIKIDVVGDPTLSATYQVTVNRTIIILGGAEIPVKGILRSEVQDYMTQQFKVYVRDPVLRATPAIRISLFGAIGKPGFIQAPANALLEEVLMSPTGGGGVANNMRAEKSKITRGDRVVVDGDQFKAALHDGMTLDQLNVEAGDQITVAAKPSAGLFWRIVAAASGLGGLVFLLVQLRII